MILDSSAIVGIVLREPGFEALVRKVGEAPAVAVGEEHWREAVTAFDRFGRGRHEAQLNFGDCMAYAVARLAGEPLLCAGTDFAKTDLTLA